jgi:hypothetical protein
MRSLRHGFKRTERERARAAFAQQQGRLIYQNLIEQSRIQQSAAQTGAGFDLDFIDFHFRKSCHKRRQVNLSGRRG